MDSILLKISIMLVPGLMAITCHEVSHGLVAYYLGDNTAKSMGRLTLNPLKHLDIFGTIMVFIIGIGWAKPVPVNFGNLRRPKRDMVWVALAGPVTNTLLALLSALALRLVVSFTSGLTGHAAQGFVEPIIYMLAFSVYINLLLAIFNLMPVPPLDGGRVAVGLLPPRQAAVYARIEPFGMIIIILLVFFTDIFSYLFLPALDVGVRLFAGPCNQIVFGVVEKFLMH